MNGILDKILVCAALGASAGYAVYSLGPRALRRRLAEGLSLAAGRTPQGLGLRRMMQRLAAAAAGKVPGACGGCDSCGEETAAAKPGAEADVPAEVSVPVSKIGRRA